MMQATQGFRQVRAVWIHNTLRPVGWFVLPWMWMGAYALGYRAFYPWRDPFMPLYRLERQGYKKILDRYEPKNLPRVLLE